MTGLKLCEQFYQSFMQETSLSSFKIDLEVQEKTSVEDFRLQTNAKLKTQGRGYFAATDTYFNYFCREALASATNQISKIADDTRRMMPGDYNSAQVS